MPANHSADWSRPWPEVVRELTTSPEMGLEPAEAAARLRRHGPNRLHQVRAQSAWAILFNQIKNLIVAFLLAAALLSFWFGDHTEALAILAVIVLNTAIGFVTELKGVRSVESLRRLGDVLTRVRRGGAVQELPATELVPGDIVVLEAGDVVTADLRLLRTSNLQADESVLTGESLPVGKDPEPLAADTPLAERRNMLFKGTIVTRGAGEAAAVATGMDTELGRISALVQETEDQTTPLEERLNQLGHRLIWLCLAVAALVAAAGIAFGQAVYLMIETAIALAVAAIPEGLPIMATIALARGVWRMARRHALITRLAAVETLGATSVIFTDKTGTLTENRLSVTRLSLPGEEVRPDEYPRGLSPALRRALEVAALCNNASRQAAGPDGEARQTGDPLEAALLAAADQAGLDRAELRRRWPRLREEAFDSETRMMATFHGQPGSYLVAVKGAPEAVLAACSSLAGPQGPRPLSEAERRVWLERNQELAAGGLRVLALAVKTADRVGGAPYQGLEFLGLVGLADPPRAEVQEAVALCRRAGIRVVMVTGDQAATARSVALAVGLAAEGEAQVVQGQELAGLESRAAAARRSLLAASVFARVSPKQKLDLIGLHQEQGAVVAMTGDGVNDAPALKKADIGVAMGRRGTQVAREAADMILTDDAFASIVHAVEQGRIIFANIRKFVLYLLSCNVSEVLAVALAALVGAPLPLLPLQILFLNLVTDVFPALALAAGEGSPGLMQRPPRDSTEPILTRSHWLAVGGYGLAITACVLGALALALHWLRMPPERAVSVSFLTLALAQLWHVFNMRHSQAGLLMNDITRNPFVWAALALCGGLLLLAVYLPGLSQVLRVSDPGPGGWLVVLVMSLLPLALGEAVRRVRRRRPGA
ncbi:MAG: cation-transporting P-type ATPase [Thermodesulfobacteriota bacterium]